MTEEEIKKIRETLDALLPNKTWAVLFWEEKKPGGYIHSTDCAIKELYIRHDSGQLLSAKADSLSFHLPSRAEDIRLVDGSPS